MGKGDSDETYLDDVLGVKTSYESAVLIRKQPRIY